MSGDYFFQTQTDGRIIAYGKEIAASGNVTANMLALQIAFPLFKWIQKAYRCVY